jgi:hypothetical protein
MPLALLRLRIFMSNLRSAQRDQSYKLFEGDHQAAELRQMWILVLYILIVVVSEAVVVAIGLILDRIYSALSLPVSLSLFFAVLWFAWILAVRLTEPKRTKSAKRAT